MNSSSLVRLLILGGCLLAAPSLRAQAPSFFTFGKQYSAEQVITTRQGTTLHSKMYFDAGNIRNELAVHGMQVVTIIRPADKKMYTVLVERKMVMEMPYNPDKSREGHPEMIAATEGGKFDLVGPDTVDGAAALKYKLTSAEGKVVFLWTDVVKQVPVKMASEDGSFSMLWKNYESGPQDPALFQPPAGYQVMQVPGGGYGRPGGGYPGGAPGQ